MTRRITGTLSTGTGTALGGLTLRLTAQTNTPTTIPAQSQVEFVTEADGTYDVTLQPGRYQVAALYSHGRAVLGHINVTSGPDTDLITLLGAEGVSPSLAQQLLDEVADLDSRLEAIETGGGADHSHANLATLAKFGESGVEVTFDGGILMRKLIYDPAGREANAFDLGQMTGNLDGGTF